MVENRILVQKIISLDFSVIFMVAGFWEEDDISSVAVDNLSSVYFYFLKKRKKIFYWSRHVGLSQSYAPEIL
jgi:hypothetical protein